MWCPRLPPRACGWATRWEPRFAGSQLSERTVSRTSGLCIPTGANITAIAGYGVEAFSSVDGAFSWINVTDGGVGVVAGVDYGPSVNYDTYYDLPGTIGLAVNELNITSGAVGASMAFSNGSVFTNVSASGAIVGIALDNTLDTSVNGLSASQTDIAVDVYNGDPTTLTHVTAFDGTVGVQITGATSHTVVTQSVFAENLGLGVGIFDGTDNFVVQQHVLRQRLARPPSTTPTSPRRTASLVIGSIPREGWGTTGPTGTSSPAIIWPPTLSQRGCSTTIPSRSGPGTYFVTFTETGLPPIGKQWSVSLDSLHASTAGTAHTPTVTSVSFAVPNGTYGYVIVGPSGYRVTSPSNPEGLLSVNGANVSKSVTFSRGATYTITFHEAGLARGKTWCVGIGANECSTTASVVFKNLTPWTYSVRNRAAALRQHNARKGRQHLGGPVERLDDGPEVGDDPGPVRPGRDVRRERAPGRDELECLGGRIDRNVD